MGGMLDGTTRLTSAGAPLHQMAMLGTFGEEAIVPEISTVKIDRATCRSRSPRSSAAACSPASAPRPTPLRHPRGRHRGRHRLRRRGPQRDPGRPHRRRRRDRRHRHVRIEARDGQASSAPRRPSRRARTTPPRSSSAASGGAAADVTFEVIGLKDTIMQAIDADPERRRVRARRRAPDGRDARDPGRLRVPLPEQDASRAAGTARRTCTRTCRSCSSSTSDGKLALDELISREIARRRRERGVRRDAGRRGRPLGHHLRVIHLWKPCRRADPCARRFRGVIRS